MMMVYYLINNITLQNNIAKSRMLRNENTPSQGSKHNNYDLSNSVRSRKDDLDQNRLMKNVYKNQLDSLIQQKNKLRLIEKQRHERQRAEYNQRLYEGQQSEKAKEASYKNYYNMLLNNQREMQGSYISPYAETDSKKDQHVTYGIEENRRKLQYLQNQRKRMESERLNSYRNELMRQMQQKRQRETRQKQSLHKNQQQYRRFARLPEQIKQIQRERRLEEMNKYRQDLDKVKQEKEIMRSRVNSQSSYGSPVSQHNALLNPMPYNIQNPYILKEIGRQQSGSQYGAPNRSFVNNLGNQY